MLATNTPLWIWIVFAAVTPVAANTIDDCKWATDDPRAIVGACTELLRANRSAEAWIYFNRGLAFKILGRLVEANNDYTKAIKVNPSFAPAYTNRGNVRALRNDLVGAIGDFKKALTLDPKDAVARENLTAIQSALRKVGADKSGTGVKVGPAR